MIREYEIFSLQTGLTYMNQSGGTKMLPDLQPRVEIDCKIDDVTIYSLTSQEGWTWDPTEPGSLASGSAQESVVSDLATDLAKEFVYCVCPIFSCSFMFHFLLCVF